MAEVEHHATAATAKLIAAETQVDSWIEDADRPTTADLEALRLLRAARLHFTVVRSS